MDVQAVLDLIAVARPSRPFVLVGVGGRGASGKTTLARAVAAATGAQVVATEEFWDGAGFDLERLRREVVEPLARGETARYRGWDWARGAPHAHPRVVRAEGVIVLEGVCALHRLVRDEEDVRVWVEAPADVRLARAVARDGEEARAAWLDVWLPGEERYVARDDPVAAAHLVVDGAAGDMSP